MTTDDFQQEIARLLRSLGVTENYKGFSPTVYAVQLTIHDPSRLQLITKMIYLDVARRYGSTQGSVERNIRTIVSVVWKRNERLLSELAGFQLSCKPNNAHFLAILAGALSKGTP